MDFMQMMLSTAVNPKVLHKLPGRLRIRISALRKLSPCLQQQASKIIMFIQELPGLKQISTNYLSGNLLVEFDENIIGEECLLSLLRSIGKFLVQHRKQLAKISEDKMLSVGKRLQIIIQEAIEQGKNLQEVSIPNDIWT